MAYGRNEMNEEYIEENNIIERYLLGELAEDEATEFEDEFVFNPKLRAELDAAEQLINALKSNSEKNDSVASINKNDSIESVTDNVVSLEPSDKKTTQRSRWLPLSLAANVLLGVGTVGFITTINEPKQNDSFVNVPTLTIEHSRSSQAAIPFIDHDGGLIRLDISNPTGHNIEFLKITDISEKTIKEEINVQGDPFRPWIDWSLDGSKLPPGKYQLIVGKSDNNGVQEQQTSSFEICDPALSNGNTCRY